MPRGKLNRLEHAWKAYQSLTEEEQLAFDKRHTSLKESRRTIRTLMVQQLGEKKADELMPRRRG